MRGYTFIGIGVSNTPPPGNYWKYTSEPRPLPPPGKLKYPLNITRGRGLIQEHYLLYQTPMYRLRRLLLMEERISSDPPIRLLEVCVTQPIEFWLNELPCVWVKVVNTQTKLKQNCWKLLKQRCRRGNLMLLLSAVDWWVYFYLIWPNLMHLSLWLVTVLWYIIGELAINAIYVNAHFFTGPSW